jgi:hypothetical protein
MHRRVNANIIITTYKIVAKFPFQGLLIPNLCDTSICLGKQVSLTRTYKYIHRIRNELFDIHEEVVNSESDVVRDSTSYDAYSLFSNMEVPEGIYI